MYVRFNAVYEADSQRIYGIFAIVGYLFDNYFIDPDNKDSEDESRLRELNEWFSHNLELPDKVWRGKNHKKPPMAVAWFKDSAAHEHIQKLHEISNIIQRHGVIVDFIRSEKPGYILYEDEHQVFAEPFND